MGKGQTFVERRLRAIVTLSPDSTYSFYSDGKNKGYNQDAFLLFADAR